MLRYIKLVRLSHYLSNDSDSKQSNRGRRNLQEVTNVKLDVCRS